MNQLEQKTITSVEVAEMISKQHSELLKDIRRYSEQLAKVNIPLGEFFSESTYKDANNQTRPCYEVTKKGCEFIGNKLTGIKGTEFTAKYINRFHDMEETISQPKKLSEREIMRAQLEMIDEVSERVDKLENTMTIDYGQQRVLERLVNSTVVTMLGGKDKVAYKKVGKKVFKECNKDIQDRFDVNSRNNIPKMKFDEACEYIKKWQPCTNTKMLIDDCNSQVAIA
ncbi:Rha family transcriptional regulator [Lachnoclostridium sp.]|uniref:Rha family transcriptional regulator n=1 Tax=Lachnoclostridium sp. TaxID=2028282 RepID=UPI00289DF894|nr:ORF6C domain-containing protein [Lachnoclostridium sp.]